MKIQKPTIGRIVEVTVIAADGETKRRPGVVVATDMGGPDGINVRVMLDGNNDEDVSANTFPPMWLTSIHHNAEGLLLPVGQFATWRYPPRSTEEIEVGA